MSLLRNLVKEFMFYLKYRPRTISEIDNEKIKNELVNILSSERLPHAFLFIGQKGTGKTSSARIFAKAINCLQNKFNRQGDSVEPCNKCPNCLSISAATNADVVEIDAASNRGIEEVKTLIRESSYLPMIGKYRVFIIDEAHMITKDAFNALLKTLEEPSASVVFILATTNLEKVPNTIVSRCMLLNFGKANRADLLRMIKRIVKEEQIKIDPQLLTLLPYYSEHSFRDAAKLLEELIIHKKLAFEEGKKYLGLVLKNNLLEVIGKGNLKNALLWLEEFIQNGGNIKNLITQLLDDLHRILLSKSGVVIENDSGLTTLSEYFSIKQIIQLMKLINEAHENLRNSPLELIPLEVAIVEFYNQRHD